MIFSNRFNLLLGIALVLFVSTSSCLSDELKRRAKWQAKFNNVTKNGIELASIVKNSPLDLAGLAAGDIFFAIDNATIDENTIWGDVTDALVSDKNYLIDYRRNGRKLASKVIFPPVPKESYKGIETFYTWVSNTQNHRQRIITTRPRPSSDQHPKKWPAIFIIQGLSCTSIESTPGRKSNFIRILRNLIENSGMIVMRVEKPGVGDSEGNCSETDLTEELTGYELALQKLISRPDVDPDRVIIYGNSMGSALAPYLANKYPINGIISDGPFFRSWFEHMLEIERRIKSMQGLTQSEIQRQMNVGYIPLYYGMLIEEKSYRQVVQEKPQLAKYNYHGDKHMYGRPMSYYHQLQDFDFEGNWVKVSVPTKVRWGTYDWIMSESDIDQIEKTLSKISGLDYEVSKYPRLDHWSTLHHSPAESFNGKEGQWESNIATQIVDWAKQLNSQPFIARKSQQQNSN